MTQKVSIIVPCYNEQESVPLFYTAISKVFSNIDYEIELLYVDDGSSDDTLNSIRKVQKLDPDHVHYLTFSRNFGKEAAMYAGLQNVTGDYVGIMDVDLQDPPELIPKMLAEIENNNYDVVGSRRVTRAGEPKIRSFFARMFYKLINKISETEIVDGARDFRIMTRQVVNSILTVTEYNRFSKGIFSWVGYKTKYLEYENRDRVAGETSWSFWKLLQYSIDGIISFSEAPLSIAVWVGLATSIGSLVAIFIIVIRTLLYGDPTAGWPSMVSIFLLVSGVILLSLGIIGKYIGKIFIEVKNRPVYIIKEKK
ncbi:MULTISPECIES: glycosyltransferase family 2 protein [Amylolactobacillus]|uniref:Glycosyl transferase 2 family protein n=2 Tax=Amylolactobacillus amylophilus DSM 20533 = JCM 1125 TaxID=1423721 RepID=A0A0R1YJR1_9LACO|nr:MULTISPECIES: glycosyltransferase family 2 protein [Amylolactobacillus]APT18292.1 glycosyltransferase [Amylolactobacillus amylophilus DSM 20533 = JCM 1125]KRM42335.1 glycosyl transferase 2 family protein [Amylolactobacillus amylophilus DSM 20533 = JCM 1125]GED80111.1 glycosyl transferase [Amylolactobacillus amylophilus]